MLLNCSRIFVISVFLSFMACAASAQSWPQSTVRLVVPFAPGGNLDLAARILAPRIAKLLGEPVIVENRPGAGGLIAGEHVARAKPDGYTVFVGAHGPLLFSPIVFQRPAYHWDKDFIAIGSVSFTGLVLQVRPSLDVKTLPDFINLARSRDLLMANAGVGSSNHLVSELLQKLTGLRWTTVNYKGNAPAINALLGGEVDFSFEQVSVAASNIRAGKLHPLAVTSRNRDPQLPDVPTFIEQGFKDFEAVTWIGLFTPAGTPQEANGRIGQALRTVLQDPEVVQQFLTMGSEARAMGAEEFKAFLQREYDKWVPVIQGANITIR